MSDDDLVISGGGTIAVATDEILARLDDLEELRAGLATTRRQLTGMLSHHPSFDSGIDLPEGVRAAIRTIDDAASSAAATAERVQLVHDLVHTCLLAYGAADLTATKAMQAVSARIAGLLGRLAPVYALPLMLNGLLIGGAVSLFTGMSPRQQAKAAQAMLRENPRLVSNPLTVAAVRATVSSVDDFGAGLLGMPPEVSELLGDSGLGLFGVRSSAAAVASAGGALGLMKERAVTVRRDGASQEVAPVAGIEERAERIPSVTKDGNQAQVRIDRYRMPDGRDAFDVYVGGTATFQLDAGPQPFDMTSNIRGVAGESPGAYRTVLEAMRQAGVTRDSPVMLTGYSQGGLIASMVAASGRFDVHGVVTFGAPTAQVPAIPDVPVLELRHTEDIVPATAGYDTGIQPVIVERTVFADHPVPTGYAVPAHRIEYYEQTGRLIDHARSRELRGIRDVIGGFAAGAESVTSTRWIGERVAEPVSGGGPTADAR